MEHLQLREAQCDPTWAPEMLIGASEAEVLSAGSRSLWGEPADRWRADNLVGTPEQVAEKVQTYLDLGCRGFIPWCSDYPDTEALELFATEVMPRLRRRSPGR